jgi:hypothetical protein
MLVALPITLFATAFLSLTNALPVLVRIEAGGIIYGILLLLARTINLSEIRRLTRRETG